MHAHEYTLCDAKKDQHQPQLKEYHACQPNFSLKARNQEDIA
jgi:hypothetical protein